MKTVRPKQPVFTKEAPKQVGLIESVLSEPIEIIGEEKKELFIEEENSITFTITLTKRQYNLYIEKGGLKWLKNAILGYKTKKKKGKK